MANIFNENSEPEIPNFNTNKIWAQKKLDEIVSQVNSEYSETNEEENNVIINKDDYNNLVQNSVGTSKIKKAVDKILLTLAFVATLTATGSALVNNYKIENAKQTYVTDISDYDKGEMHSTYVEHWYDFDVLGSKIADSIIGICENTDSKTDPNIEVMKALGLMIDEVAESSYEYNMGDSIDESSKLGWAEKMYSVIRKELIEAGIIELPNDFCEYLEKNGFGGKFIMFDPVTGMLHYKNVEKNDALDMLKNLLAYVKFGVVNDGLEKGGR